jgi:hypothetical protein
MTGRQHLWVLIQQLIFEALQYTDCGATSWITIMAVEKAGDEV